jgi:hypothetical protein
VAGSAVPNLHGLAAGPRGQSELAIGIRESAVGRIVGDIDDRPFNGRAFLVDHHTRELLLLCRQLELDTCLLSVAQLELLGAAEADWAARVTERTADSWQCRATREA